MNEKTGASFFLWGTGDRLYTRLPIVLEKNSKGFTWHSAMALAFPSRAVIYERDYYRIIPGIHS